MGLARGENFGLSSFLTAPSGTNPVSFSTIPPVSSPTTNRVAVIDVMVVYTSEARTGAGGTEPMRSLIDLAVAEANTVFQNSLVNVRLRLVYAGEINYTEFPSNATNLSRLKLKNDGFMDDVHLIRETNRADLVCLVTEYSDPGLSGLAFTMSEPSTDFRESAFSVVKRSDLVGTFLFAHEISHNFGAQHDREHALDAQGKLIPGAYPFSFGYRFAVNGTTYHDVMSYAPGSPIPYLSNPDVKFLGVPVGVAGITNGSNNALTLNTNAIFVGSFYGNFIQTVPPAIQLTSPTNGASFTAGTNLIFSAQASDIDGAVRQVEFYHENTLIGISTNPVVGLGTNLYSAIWSNATPGRYTLAARAIDDLGASSAAFPTEFIVRPANDNFTNRIALSSTAPAASGSSREATMEPNEPMHGGNPGGSSVWYSWLAPKSGTVTLTATGLGVVPLAEVYKSLTSTTSISISREFQFDPTNFIAQTTFDAFANQNYSIAIDSLEGTSGDFSFDLVYHPAPPNDDFENRTQISGESVAFSSTNADATSEPGEPPKHAQNQGGKSVWYGWTAPKAGPVTVLIVATNFFPLADVYLGASVSTITNEPSRTFLLDVTNRMFTLTFDAQSGRDYALVVDGFNAESGPFDFKLNYPPAPANDNFTNRSALFGSNLNIQTSNLFATKENGEPDKHAGVASARSIWYSWLAPVSGPVTVTSRGDGFISWLAAYSGNSITNLAMAPATAVKYDTNTLATTLNFNATALQSYALVFDGFQGRSGAISFTLVTSNSPPAILPLSVPILLSAGFKLAIAGAIGQKFALQASTNLTGWSEIFSGPFVTNKFEFSDTNSGRFQYRFYRVLPLP